MDSVELSRRRRRLKVACERLQLPLRAQVRQLDRVLSTLVLSTGKTAAKVVREAYRSWFCGLGLHIVIPFAPQFRTSRFEEELCKLAVLPFR